MKYFAVPILIGQIRHDGKPRALVIQPQHHGNFAPFCGSFADLFSCFRCTKQNSLGYQCINGLRVVNVIYVKHARIGDVWVVTLCSRRSTWYDAEQCCSAKCWINFSEKWLRRSLQNTVSIASRVHGLLQRISKGKNSACKQKASQTSLRFLTNNFQSTFGNFPEGFVQSLGTLGAKVPVFGVSQLPR